MPYRGRSRGREDFSDGGSRNGGNSKHFHHDDRYDGKLRSDIEDDYPRRDDGGRTSRGGDGYHRRSNYRGGGRSRFRGRGGRYNQGNCGRGEHHNRYGNRDGKVPAPRRDARNTNEDLDGDVNMDGSAQPSQRYNPYARPSRPDRSSRGNRGGGYQQKEYKKNWYLMTVINGSMIDENWLKQQIENTALIEYVCEQFHVDGQNCSFFVDNPSIAESIKNCTKKITGPDGNSLVITMRVRNDGPLMQNQISKIQEVLRNRYTASTQHLNASNLYGDEKLRSEGVYLKFNTNHHVAVIVKTIAQHFSDLQEFDASNNHIAHFDGLRQLCDFTPLLKKLDLAKNNIQYMNELTKLKKWDLFELTLDENPLCAKYKSETEYISDVREYFPNLLVLDHRELPAPVKFDLDTVDLPPDIRHFLATSPQVSSIIELFIKEYFACYDAIRSQAEAAYHEDCIFTLTIPSSPRGPPLRAYLDHSRNLKKMKSMSAKVSTAVTGRERVMEKFRQLPATKHHVEHFSVEVPLVTSELVNFVVRGFFKEENFTRAFTRNFLCKVINPSGLLIINDQYFVRNSTAAEVRNLKTQPAAVKTNKQVAQSPPDHGMSSDQARHDEMVMSFVRESGMNASFSRQCLEDNGWDYQKAGSIFLTLQREGKIPPEAFVS